uniref:delta-1-pyrroline-5-carboxylate synthase-like isoform X2 n=1 Tax=Fragaria vesca subsp. vesca TaxID=101020 RepID=UPI0005C8D636|nr:PREDICTED: delta-1-pyrroline-5-carboxylate synthase-like isoform X2 [Fragaria vesca subsp. vesca]
MASDAIANSLSLWTCKSSIFKFGFLCFTLERPVYYFLGYEFSVFNILELKQQSIEVLELAAQEAGYDRALIARLALKPGKISSLAKSMRQLADMDEPIGRVLQKTEVADGLILEKATCPLGVLLVVFESRTDALVQDFLK